MKKTFTIYTIAIASLCPAVSLRAQTSPEELTEQGRAAFMNYDYSLANEKFAEARRKSKKSLPANLEAYQEELTRAENFLSRVEDIVILDSIAVPKRDFFMRYRLPSSAGQIGDNSALPFEMGDVDCVFTSENGEYKIWGRPDSKGKMRIWESIKLTDGNWSDPTPVSSILANGANAAYPFMMTDGVTLYYASDSKESLGGYDLFVATRDPADGKYRQPQNLGMPYNSPYDDYMLAIDEQNGVGWWATDRNQLGDHLTIYLYKINDVRSNLNPDETPDLADRARIRNFRNSWQGRDYSEFAKKINNIESESEQTEYEFIFPIKGGGKYTSYQDFKNSSARALMKKYVAASAKLKANNERLAGMRRKFYNGGASALGAQIRTLEIQVDNERESLRKLRSDIYRLEFPTGKGK